MESPGAEKIPEETSFDFVDEEGVKELQTRLDSYKKTADLEDVNLNQIDQEGLLLLKEYLTLANGQYSRTDWLDLERRVKLYEEKIFKEIKIPKPDFIPFNKEEELSKEDRNYIATMNNDKYVKELADPKYSLCGFIKNQIVEHILKEKRTKKMVA